MGVSGESAITLVEFNVETLTASNPRRGWSP